MIYKRNPNAVYIELVPKVEGTYWTGEVLLNIIADPDSKLDDESKASLMHLSQLVASSVPIMDLDPTLLNKMENFLDSFVKEKFVKRDKNSNIIHINFKTKKRDSC
tara:strand:+ start:261 stop:578 length:318 start_codon:yes stop_codon:yes gene_type:complete